jgi:hypothetical protein
VKIRPLDILIIVESLALIALIVVIKIFGG